MKLISLLLLLSIPAFNQSIGKKLREVKLTGHITSISVDRLGGFYTVTDCGIKQFNPEGKQLGAYTPRGCTPTEIFESWNYVRSYAYQKTKQQFLVFNNNMEMEIEKQFEIDPATAFSPQLATISSDLKSYWLIDEDNSLKRVDLSNQAVILESDALKEVKGKFVHIREYQNMLFVLNGASGIYVLNKLGGMFYKIDAPTSYFNFAGEDLYYLKDGIINFFNIFNKEKYTVKVSAEFRFSVITDERLILIKDGLAEVYEYTPIK